MLCANIVINWRIKMDVRKEEPLGGATEEI
jgi:hypothetical protein